MLTATRKRNRNHEMLRVEWANYPQGCGKLAGTRIIMLLLQRTKSIVTLPPTALGFSFARHCPIPPRSIVASSRLCSPRTLACRLPNLPSSSLVTAVAHHRPPPSTAGRPRPPPRAVAHRRRAPSVPSPSASQLGLPRSVAVACGASATEADLRLTPYRSAAILLSCILGRVKEPGDIVAHPRGDDSLSSSSCLFSRL
jgi:hypothetical protein